MGYWHQANQSNADPITPDAWRGSDRITTLDLKKKK